ncbi:MAG: hypothetical protein ACREUL_18605 [Steroidobacteraceae bacterium]
MQTIKALTPEQKAARKVQRQADQELIQAHHDLSAAKRAKGRLGQIEALTKDVDLRTMPKREYEAIKRKMLRMMVVR